MERDRDARQDSKDVQDRDGRARDLGHYLPLTATTLFKTLLMECWLITSRAEVMRLDFGDEPPPEICLPDKPLSEIEDEAPVKAIQDSPYIVYRRYHLAHESWRLGIVYSLAPPTVGDIQILSAYRAGHESRPRLV
jgi:hypothetical protein